MGCDRDLCSSYSHPKSLLGARRGVVCLDAAFFFLASPGGALRPMLVPAGWGALGGCHLARFGGKTAPPLVHSIGLRPAVAIARSCQPVQSVASSNTRIQNTSKQQAVSRPRRIRTRTSRHLSFIGFCFQSAERHFQVLFQTKDRRRCWGTQ